MTDTKELARRAIACKDWRWMRGMSVVSDVDHDALVWHDTSIVYVDPDDVPGFEYIDADLPDLTDPATLGCLLHLVREHFGDLAAYTKRVYRLGGTERWICTSPNMQYPLAMSHGDTEAEALVNALEMKVQND